MFKSILAAALLTSVLATGALAATPAAKAPAAAAKPAVVMLHKTAMKKPMVKLHHCAKDMHMSKGKCVK